KILQSIQRLNLDLKGKVVLTEAATGAYVVTPVLAALAGAEVYAFTKNTKYGTVEEVRNLVNELASSFDRKLSINVIDKLTPEIISKADIITNSGHLRPLDEKKLRHAKKGVVIPLMYEAWEWRDADLDLAFCKKQNIKVGATNERHPEVDVFNYLGDMALKMIFDAGLCPYKNNFILICNNSFGPHIAKVVSAVCAGLAVCDTAENKKNYNGIDIDWIGDFPDFQVAEKYRNSDAVIFTAYPFVDTWIGDKNEAITIKKLRSEINDPFILRYAGHLDEDACKGSIKFYPSNVQPGHMGILPSAIGFDPIIRLQSGGLKAGELLLKGETEYKGVALNDLIYS
ncbi:MAG TPA: hypothetical protein PL029_04940, partial [Bacteroidia bacterium]|nr:hypothetical protein [Bacteroidia bacterium]